MSQKIRVLVADEPTALRDELLRVIESQPDMELVGQTESGAEVRGLVGRLEPDVVLLDLAVPGGGLRAMEELTDRYPHIRVVVLAVHEDISLLRSVLAINQMGYVVHRSAHAELLSVIRKMYGGRGYIEVPTGGLRIDPGFDPHSPKGRELQAKLDLLSRREREVLRAVAYGYTNREIAGRLGISVKSVETYRYRLADKLEFRNRVDLVRFALECGLLRTDREGFTRNP
jgi:DNA-binding NarL/FixJ family response regulator